MCIKKHRSKHQVILVWNKSYHWYVLEEVLSVCIRGSHINFFSSFKRESSKLIDARMMFTNKYLNREERKTETNI